MDPDEDHDVQLSNKYRPRRLAEVLGSELMKKTVAGYAAADRVPRTMLLLGPPGVGKTTTARVIAAALNCPERPPDGDCCGHCRTCNAILNPPSWDPGLFVIDASRSGSVDVARDMRYRVFTAAHPAKVRVVFFDEAHNLSREAMDVYLAMWEEPPPHTLSIIATTETQKVPQVVKSRSHVFHLGALKVDQLRPRLRYVCDQEGIKAEDDLLTSICARTQGIPRDALGLLEKCWMADITRAADLPADSEEHDGGVASDLLAAAMCGQESAVKQALKLVHERGLASDVAERLRELVTEAARGGRDGVGTDRQDGPPMLASVSSETLSAMAVAIDASGRVRTLDDLARLVASLMDATG